MTQATSPNPTDLWMPLFGIHSKGARAAQLRRMLDNIPWDLADQLYGSRWAMEARVAQMRAELASLERQIEAEDGPAQGDEETDTDLEMQLQVAIPNVAYTGKAYIGIRPQDYPKRDVRVWVVEGETRRPLTHYPYHSPDGYEWEYGGSGPSDLALAILADLFGEEPTREKIEGPEGWGLGSWRLHIPFKQEVVACLPYRGWCLGASDVEAWAVGKLEEVEQAEQRW